MFYMITSVGSLLLNLQQLSTEDDGGNDIWLLQSKPFTFYKQQVQKSLQ